MCARVCMYIYIYIYIPVARSPWPPSFLVVGGLEGFVVGAICWQQKWYHASARVELSMEVSVSW